MVDLDLVLKRYIHRSEKQPNAIMQSSLLESVVCCDQVHNKQGVDLCLLLLISVPVSCKKKWPGVEGLLKVANSLST